MFLFTHEKHTKNMKIISTRCVGFTTDKPINFKEVPNYEPTHGQQIANVTAAHRSDDVSTHLYIPNLTKVSIQSIYPPQLMGAGANRRSVTSKFRRIRAGRDYMRTYPHPNGHPMATILL